MTEKQIGLAWLGYLAFYLLVWLFALTGLIYVVISCQALQPERRIDKAFLLDPNIPPAEKKVLWQKMAKQRSATGEWIDK